MDSLLRFVGWIAVCLALILCIFIIDVAALSGWRVTIDFNRYGEGLAELVLLHAILGLSLVVTAASEWRAWKHRASAARDAGRLIRLDTLRRRERSDAPDRAA